METGIQLLEPATSLIEMLHVRHIIAESLSNEAHVRPLQRPYMKINLHGRRGHTKAPYSISIRVSLSPDIKTAVLKAAFNTTLNHS